MKYFVVLLVLFFVYFETHGYVQELVFHEKEDESGNFYTFRDNVPDLTVHAGLKNAVKICFRGTWTIYHLKNYDMWTSCCTVHPETICVNQTVFSDNDFTQQSFRRFGASDTDVNSLTIGFGALDKPEVYIETHALADIPNISRHSYLYQTGQSPWTLFEGQNFDGNHVCINGTGTGGIIYNGDISEAFGLATIGSVMKGCFPDRYI